MGLFVSTSFARIGVFALPAVYGIKDTPTSWTDINTRTWRVFTNFDGSEILGLESERRTLIQTEFYSSGVIEGRKVGDTTIVASFSDRGEFFGGEGYTDLCGFVPLANKYATQIDFLGGWKYNITALADIDLGGHITYTDKKVAGPGFTGLGGSQWKGDFYVGLVFSKLYLNPFAYLAYEPSYDAMKLMFGIFPVFDLEPITAIEGLSFEMQVLCGYTDANNWAADDTINGNRWRNSYFYIQTEANIVYVWNKKIRFFTGVGYAYNNDSHFAPNGAYLSPQNVVWFSGGIGYLF